MGPYITLPDAVDEVDVVIAGGGTAGCVVAARLAAALPSLSLLLIEGGADNAGNPTVSHPLLFFTHLDPKSPNNIMYTSSSPEPQLAGRQLAIPAGGILGGGSSINMMAYSRALLRDWDAWETEGWRGENMIPFLKKFETYVGPGDAAMHGSSGPIQVSRGTFASPRAATQFISAAESLGFPEVEDLNDLVTASGVQRQLRYISPSGLRQDAASRYLRPLLEDERRQNLHVLLEHRVGRVLFEGTRAAGVEFMANPEFQRDEPPKARSVRARKMVVVSCGSLASPSVLERSGVGSASVLRRARVEQIVADLPGVGEGYHDHPLILHSYHTALEPSETINSALTDPEVLGKWLQEGNDILGSNAQEVAFKVRPSDEDVAGMGREFQHRWEREFKNGPPRPLVGGALVMACLEDPSPAPRQNISISSFNLYPESRGSLHITGPSPSDPVDFHSGILSDPAGIDLTEQVWAYKTHREMIRRTPMYRGEVAVTHPRFPAGSAAACVYLDITADAEEEESTKRRRERLTYTAEDDAAIEQWLREHIGTAWHPLGTCKMAPREKGGVVDKNLSVYGVQGLKVADLSIAAGGIGANTCNSAFAVGEKAADIFIRELVGDSQA
ncbi:alcohol oxidase-like protein [Dichotomopilus funicola]|uniref:Alcohol oxidase-like protein n=1 Tax=Dichotomopilus funicola TaxID=1934379 RepID=A0AAN6UW40_9PEZI|nr:alcohol oxidase-like protein [Dichotomopilus funicola]